MRTFTEAIGQTLKPRNSQAGSAIVDENWRIYGIKLAILFAIFMLFPY
jgi:hypothetical protein